MPQTFTHPATGFVLAFALLSSTATSAQGQAQQQQSPQQTIRGYIEDAATGERLLGATVYDPDARLGASTNNYGFFSYSYRADTLRLSVSYVGYATLDTTLLRPPLSEIVFRLSGETALAIVEIRASDASERIAERVQMSAVDVPIEQIKRAPALLGETDVLKTLQFLPGVAGGAEGTAGLYVRGGSPDQNLILLDGVPVYNPSHVLGIFSVFNADAINSVSIMKGGFPARYGGRLSSVLEINMRDGHKDKWHGEGGIGIISSRLTLDGPAGDKTRVLVSARRTYFDLLTRPIAALSNRDLEEGERRRTKLNFYDLNLKVRHELNDRHRLYLSGYTGGDVFGIVSREVDQQNGDYDEFEGGTTWGNAIGALRWNWEIGPRAFSNATVSFSDYAIRFNNSFERREDSTTETFSARYTSGIRDLAMRYDLDFVPNPRHQLRTGIGLTHHRYTPGVTQLDARFDESRLDTSYGQRTSRSLEGYAYVEDEWRLSAKLRANVGLHFSAFAPLSDTAAASRVYTSLQPRVALRYLTDGGLAYKASFATMAQYVNLLTSEALSLPSDLWVPSTARVLPQRSWQAALGVAKSYRKYELSAEAFYKDMRNVVSYVAGASFFDAGADVSWEDKVTQGRGEVYGLELFAQRKLGRTTGWVGYTLSWNTRIFADLNGGRTFPFRYDRRHDLGVLVSHEFSKRIVGSAAWTYATGAAYTLPTYSFGASYNYSYANNPDGGDPSIRRASTQRLDQAPEKNNYRMTASQRLDLSIELRRQKRWGERAWVFGVYNAYFHKNPFYVTPREDYTYTDGKRTGKRQYVEQSILPILPSVSYKFKF